MGSSVLLKLYRQKALQVHPDKAIDADQASATEAFKALEHAKLCLCTSNDQLIRYARIWLRTSREKAAREREIIAARAEREKRERELREQSCPDRSEGLPGLVLMQGQLSQTLRSNQRMSTSGKASSSEAIRTISREAADALHRMRSKVFQKTPVSRTATTEEKKIAHNDTVRRVVHTRTDKKLSRALAKVEVDRAVANSRNEQYRGPSEAGYKRTAYGWMRAGIHNESLKPIFAARRENRDSRLRADVSNDEWMDHGYGTAREDWRQYRRRQQEAPNEGCRVALPPRRAKPSANRKATKRQNYQTTKANKSLRAEAAKVLSKQDVPLALSFDVSGTSCTDNRPNHNKPTRRGGKAAKRRRTSHENAWSSNDDGHLSTSKAKFMMPAPK